MAKTSIEWTDRTWNPVRGCSRVSPGCVNCYAEKVSARFSNPGQPFEGFAKIGRVVMTNGQQSHTTPFRWTGKVELIEHKLDEPLHWRTPQKVFVNSMSDLFHESLPDEAIDRVFAVMAGCTRHTFQVLTKRADRMRRLLSCQRPPAELADMWPLKNVWLGVSVENQQYADERIPLLLETPAAVRFVSYEPALGPVDFRAYLYEQISGSSSRARESFHLFHQPPLDWIIVGGESGPGARPFHFDWAHQTIEQCKAAGVACFVKQLGANPRDHGSKYMCENDPKKGGDPADWPRDFRVREFPTPRAVEVAR